MPAWISSTADVHPSPLKAEPMKRLLRDQWVSQGYSLVICQHGTGRNQDIRCGKEHCAVSAGAQSIRAVGKWGKGRHSTLCP